MADTENKKIVAGFVDEAGVKAIISQRLENIEDKSVTKDDVNTGLTYEDGKLNVNTIKESDVDGGETSDDTYYSSSATKKLIQDTINNLNNSYLLWQ